MGVIMLKSRIILNSSSLWIQYSQFIIISIEDEHLHKPNQNQPKISSQPLTGDPQTAFLLVPFQSGPRIARSVRTEFSAREYLPCIPIANPK